LTEEKIEVVISNDRSVEFRGPNGEKLWYEILKQEGKFRGGWDFIFPGLEDVKFNPYHGSKGGEDATGLATGLVEDRVVRIEIKAHKMSGNEYAKANTYVSGNEILICIAPQFQEGIKSNAKNAGIEVVEGRIIVKKIPPKTIRDFLFLTVNEIRNKPTKFLYVDSDFNITEIKKVKQKKGKRSRKRKNSKSYQKLTIEDTLRSSLELSLFYKEVKNIISEWEFEFNLSGKIIQVMKDKTVFFGFGMNESGQEYGINVNILRWRDSVTKELKLFCYSNEDERKLYHLDNHGSRKGKSPGETYSRYKQISKNPEEKSLIFYRVHKKDFDKPLSLIREIVRREQHEKTN
jgi:hypothetical protein